MKKTVLTFLMCAALSTVALAHGKKHVHGEGRLDAAIDKEQLTLNLELPLDVAVGFERKPKNDKERAALEAAATTLQDAASLWSISPNAACQLVSAQVGLPKFDGEHADIAAQYVYRCAQVQGLKSVETSLFKSFKRLYRVEVQQVGPSRQGASRLTPKNPLLRW